MIDGMKMNKNMWIGLGAAIVVVVLIAIGVNRSYKSKVDSKMPGESTQEEIPEIVVNQIGKKARTSQIDAMQKDVIVKTEHDYEKSLVVFANKRIQFDQACNATPAASTFAQGEEVMIDNRSNQFRTVVIGSQNITVEAYDFTIATLSEKGNFGVDCGAQMNAAKILVQ